MRNGSYIHYMDIKLNVIVEACKLLRIAVSSKNY